MVSFRSLSFSSMYDSQSSRSEVVQRGAPLLRVLRMAAGRIQDPIHVGVGDGELPLAELLLDVRQPVVRIDAEPMAGGVGEIEGQREAIEGPALAAEQPLEDGLLRAEECVRHRALRLKACAHEIEHPRAELAGRLELVERD